MVTRYRPLGSQIACNRGPKLQTPTTHCLVGHVQTAFGHQIFDISEARTSGEKSVTLLLGCIVLAIAHAERSIDYLVIWHRNARNLSDEHPRALSRKLSYLKTKMETDGLLTDAVCHSIRSIRIETARMSEIRHDVAHGTSPRLNIKTLDWPIERFIYPDKVPTLRKRVYSLSEIAQAAEDANKLCGDAFHIWEQVKAIS